MASGYEKFTNEAGEVEGGVHAVPPTYEETCAKPTATPMDQTQQNPAQQQPQYPPQQPAQYPPQQPAQFPQQLSQFPQQQPSPYVYQQQMTQAPVQQNIVHVTNQTMPNDYFHFALLVTLFCCLPFGIVALIKSSALKSRFAVGDFNGAALSSAEAKSWSTFGLVFGGVTIAGSAFSGFMFPMSGGYY